MSRAHAAIALGVLLAMSGHVDADSPRESTPDDRASPPPAVTSPADASLPAPGATYADADPAAVGFHAPPGRNAALRLQLDRTLRSRPNHVAALIERGYLRHAAGDVELGDADFQRALKAGAGVPEVARRAAWSLGWSAFNRGDARAALDYWEASIRLHGGRPFWQPYTYAVGYWQLGEQAVAIAWYDRAAEADPRWRRLDTLRERTRFWKAGERAVIEAVFAAWSATRESGT